VRDIVEQFRKTEWFTSQDVEKNNDRNLHLSCQSEELSKPRHQNIQNPDWPE